MFGVSRQIRQMGVEALTKPWLSHRNDVLLRRTKVHGTILRGGHQRPRKWPQWVKDLKVQFLCTCLQNAFSSLAWWYSVLSQVKLYLCHHLPVKLILLQPNASFWWSLSKPTRKSEKYSYNSCIAYLAIWYHIVLSWMIVQFTNWVVNVIPSNLVEIRSDTVARHWKTSMHVTFQRERWQNAFLFDQPHPNEVLVRTRRRLGLCTC